MEMVDKFLEKYLDMLILFIQFLWSNLTFDYKSMSDSPTW